jgi:deoxyribonuclease-4
VDRAEVRLLIEPTAGAGEAMASTVESTIELMVALNDERIGLCLDTCHLHAAGEDLAEPDKLVNRITDALGPQSIGLIHVNDSRDPLGSHRDRHESLGSGTLDPSAFEALLTVPALRNVPMLVETPTHNRDVAILKSLRSKSADHEATTRHPAAGGRPRRSGQSVPGRLQACTPRLGQPRPRRTG